MIKIKYYNVCPSLLISKVEGKYKTYYAKYKTSKTDCIKNDNQWEMKCRHYFNRSTIRWNTIWEGREGKENVKIIIYTFLKLDIKIIIIDIFY